MTAADDQVDALAENAVQDAISRALTNFKSTVFFEKKISDGNYGGDTVGIHVQFDHAPEADAEEFLAQAREAFNWAAMAVYERLDLEFHRDDSGVVRQLLNAFPGATVETPPTVASPSGVPPAPPFTEDQIKAMSSDEAKDAKRAVKEWAAAHLAAYPSDWWDNRATKKGQQPDFKHKKLGIGYWAD